MVHAGGVEGRSAGEMFADECAAGYERGEGEEDEAAEEEFEVVGDYLL